MSKSVKLYAATIMIYSRSRLSKNKDVHTTSLARRRWLALPAALCLSVIPGVGAQAASSDFEQASTAETSEGSAQSAALFCSFTQNGDWVHISATLPRAASAHGWWVNGDCNATQADVTVQLQIYKSGGWKNVGSPGRKRVYSGGGSANRAAARVTCSNSNSYKWRSVIDVDVVGVVDASNKLTTGEKSMACYA